MVFFDAMEIGFQYEPEGFILSDGVRYLPDFLIPRIRCWAEAKPFPPTEAELNKAKRLVVESGLDLLWLVAPPDFRDYTALMPIKLEDPPEIVAEETIYRLDIYEHLRRYFDDEHRLFGAPGDKLTEGTCSEEFGNYIHDYPERY